jgi:hypothetical protein
MEQERALQKLRTKLPLLQGDELRSDGFMPVVSAPKQLEGYVGSHNHWLI